MLRILCLLGYHRRSRGRVRHDGQTFVSVCRRCELPLEKSPDGNWVPVEQG